MNLLLTGILAYVGAQLLVGVLVARRIQSEEDYLVAGRRIGPVLATASIFATWFGAETCIGAAGQVHDEGLGVHSVEPFAYGLCLVLMGLLFAAPLWRRKILTLADLFRTRYSPRVERYAAILLIPTSLLWAAAQVRAFGHVLATTSEALDLDQALALAAGTAILYTVCGGLLADVLTDVVQGAALVVGLVVLFIVVVGDMGGVEAALEAGRTARAAAGRVAPDVGWLDGLEAWAIPICGSVVAQEVVSRALAARSPGTARGAAVGGGLLYLAVGLLPVFLGLVGPALVAGLDDGEALLPALAMERLHPLLFVVFAGALVSAILSTVDSALLVAGSLFARNVLPLRGSNDRTRLLAARSAVAVFGLLAWFLAARSEGVFALVEAASGFGSSGILVCVVFGLFTGIGGPRSAAAALTAGIVVWLAGTELGSFRAPYLCSLAAALVAFVGTAVLLPGDSPRRSGLQARAGGGGGVAGDEGLPVGGEAAEDLVGPRPVRAASVAGDGDEGKLDEIEQPVH